MVPRVTSLAPRIAAIAVVPAMVFGIGACSSNTATPAATSATPSGTQAAQSGPTPSPTTLDGVTVSGALGIAPTIVVTPNTPAPKALVTTDIYVGTGTQAVETSTVTAQYSGVLLATGEPFNSSWADNDGQPSTFPLDNVIPGWQKGIPGMKVGGRRLLIIPSGLAYGAAGRPPAIPPNSPLVFVVDLVSVP